MRFPVDQDISFIIRSFI